MVPCLRQEACPVRPVGPYRRLGHGACGSVWTPSEATDPFACYVFKREDGSTGRSLQREFNTHRRVLWVFRLYMGMLLQDPDDPDLDLSWVVSIPYCYDLLVPGSPDHAMWWDATKARFPRSYTRCLTVQMERIPSLPEDVRRKLIKTFCPTSLIGQIERSQSNRHCLVRPYLGRRRYNSRPFEGVSGHKPYFCAFSLHNYPLYLDQMEILGIGKFHMSRYAVHMAEILAMLHWVAELDGNGIEFVLAPPRRAVDEKSKHRVHSPALGSHVVWVLDFDCCNTIPMNEEGVNQAVRAFCQNDPYYPRPGLEHELWKVFENAYFRRSDIILRHRTICGEKLDPDLPIMFIEGVEQELRYASKTASVLPN
ncbi:hypothetical protein VTO42DRAFT_92 [Malbranchea cinnamomea]